MKKIWNDDKCRFEEAEKVECPRCRGFGYVVTDGVDCAMCAGWGYLWKSKQSNWFQRIYGKEPFIY